MAKKEDEGCMILGKSLRALLLFSRHKIDFTLAKKLS